MITRDLEKKPSGTGLKEVAARAAVSTMTVSRVMRGSGHVREETRARVLAAAAALGYRPDPLAARLMAVVRKGKGRRIKAALALVRDRRQRMISGDGVYRYVDDEDIRERAERHGYAVDEFSLGEDGLTVARLRGILLARGIEGVLFSAEAARGAFEGFDVSSFACATFGYGWRVPALHRASTNMMQGLQMAFDQLTGRGYRRIGLAITPWIDERSDHTYSGALLHFQAGLPPARRVPHLIFKGNDLPSQEKEFCRWAKRHRPDALISFDRCVPQWTRERLGLRIPEDIGFVAHDWTEEAAEGLSGICHNRKHVVAAAVDLVANQLFHNEHGIPAVPREVLIPATWIEGGSC